METWSLQGARWSEGETAGAEAYWFNHVGAGDGGLAALAARLGLHPLAVEDCLSPLPHAPKIDDFTDYIFVVLQVLTPSPSGPKEEELDAFVAKDFLVTYADRPIAAIQQMVEALRQGLAVRPGTDGLFYEIADRAVDASLPQVNVLAEQLDRVQDRVVEAGGGPADQRSILRVRARAGRIRRLLTPQLIVFQRLSRGELLQVAEGNRIYFRDIYDHLVRIDLALEGLREDAEVALSTYLSALNNRMNEVMKVLSVVGALALPAIVIAGVFGTNFHNVPGLYSDWGFAVMIGSMGALALGMGWYFRRRGWF